MKNRRFLMYIVVVVCPLYSFGLRSAAVRHRGTSRVSFPSFAADSHQDSKGIHRVNELLRLANIDTTHCQVEPLSGPGFCNALYKVRREATSDGTTDQLMVAKLYSPIAKERIKINGNRIEWMASKHGLGPTLFASTDDGILMRWVEGNEMNESTVHSTTDWIETVAPRLAEFHAMERPPRPPHMLWETMDVMMKMTNDQANVILREQVLRQREMIDPLNLPVALGHGDLKPSNIIGNLFIDFEVSGMHYRGFDLAKLFRTKHPTLLSDDNMNAFPECYLRASSEPVDDIGRELELLKLETKLMEPLTWLEAAVFFVCSASVDSEGADRWNQLATDRLKSYDASMHGWESNVAEYQMKQ